MGSPEDMQLFVTLENEYTQWWEMATVLIEVGSTGTEEGAGTAPTVRTRRITLATDDARAASEAFETLSLSQRGPSYSTVKSVSTEASDVFSSDAEEDPRSKQDLSERQLEMLRTMLRTPVSASDSIVATVDERQALRARMRQSMPVAPTPREILPSGPATMRVNGINGGAALPPPPARPPRPVEPTYVVPSAYPSPETAAMLAQPRPRGLTGLRDFLRTLKSTGNKGADSRRAATAPSPVTPTPTPGAGAIYTGIGRHDIESPLPTPGLESGGNTMNTMRDSDGDSRAAPPMTLEAKKQRRRPSLKNIFRPGSGNWHELVRATPPGSPMPTLPMVGTMPTIPSPGQMVEDPDDEASGALTPSRLPRPPSIPAFPRKPYGTLTKHQQQRTDSPEPLPQTPPADDATLRLKSRVLGLGLGLGHPSEASPSRVNSSPARAAGPQTPNELLVPEEMPRSRSDIGPGGGAAQRDEEVIALTPENLPVLLDYVRQCEKRLQEWRVRAANLEKGGAGAMGMGAEE
jgi:hypothetical protein